MANEIRLTASITSTANDLDHLSSVASKMINQVAPGFHTDVEKYSSAPSQTLDAGAVTTPGWLFLHNISTQGAIVLGKAAGQDIIELCSGEIALFRMDPSTTIVARELNNVPYLEWMIAED